AVIARKNAHTCALEELLGRVFAGCAQRSFPAAKTEHRSGRRARQDGFGALLAGNAFGLLGARNADAPLAQLAGLANAVAQEEELRAALLTAAHYFDTRDMRRMHRENALHAFVIHN